jgi:MGT family glycosyltransferase
MGRFLFVVPPLEGHINPTICVAGELRERGHDVAWVGHTATLRRVLPREARIFELDDQIPQSFFRERLSQAHRVRGLESLRFVFEDFFLPLARAMVPGVSDAVRAYEPTVMVVDQQTLAGMIVARQHGVTWATSSTTAAGVVDPFRELPKVRAWLTDQLVNLQQDFDLAPPKGPSDQSPHLVLVFSTKELVGGSHEFPDHIRFVGPAISNRPDPVDFPCGMLRDPPRVLVTLGTVNLGRGGQFYRTAVEALGPSQYQIILVAPENALEQAPRNFMVRTRIPQLTVLPHVQAVVCHAGQNTVAESLFHGLPLVVLPIKDDQTVIAQQVVEAGAGLRLRFGRTSPAELRRAVDLVLEDLMYRRSAERIRASFIAAGGAARAAQLLEEVS